MVTSYTWKFRVPLLLVLGACAAGPAVATYADEHKSAAPPEEQTLVTGLLARSDAVFSGRLVYRMTSGFVGKTPLQESEYEFSFSWPSWALRNVRGGGAISHGGKQVEYASNTTDQQGNVRNRALVLMPKGLKETWPHPPFPAGTLWFDSTREWIESNQAKGRLIKHTVIGETKVQIIEWDVPRQEISKAFQWVGPHVRKGGTLRLYVAPQLAYALPLVEHVGVDGHVDVAFKSKEFKEDAPGIFFPRECDLELATGYYTRFRITSVEKLNEAIPENDFKIELPEGTSVADSRSGKESIIFRVGDDSVPVSDLNDIVITPVSGHGWFPWWMKAALGGMILAAIGLVVYMVARRKRVRIV